MTTLPDFGVFTTALFYSVLILVAPLVTFFITKTIIFDGIIGASNVTSNVWSAAAAVLVLHIVLGIYLVKAYSDPGKRSEKKDDKVD